MADIFDNVTSNLTFNLEEARTAQDLVVLNPYLTPELSAVHGVQTGVQMDKRIPILGQMAEIGHLDAGNCSSNTETGAFAASEKTWTPKIISSRIPLCVSDLPANIKFWMESPNVKARWETISDPAKQYVLDVVGQAQTRSIIRLAEFGDTAADVIAQGGTLTAGTDKTLFTPLDGMWKQIFTDQAGAALSYRYTITENSAATKAAQNALADDAAYEVMKNLVENISPEAEGGNMVIQITKSLYNNWVAYMENKAGAYRPEILTDGTTKESFRGIKIVVRKDWDRIIKTYFDNTVTLDLPHRAIYCDINNIPVGTRDTESLSTLDSFYDKVTKKVYVDMAYSIDSKVLIEEYVAVAY